MVSSVYFFCHVNSTVLTGRNLTTIMPDRDVGFLTNKNIITLAQQSVLHRTKSHILRITLNQLSSLKDSALYTIAENCYMLSEFCLHHCIHVSTHAINTV